MNVVAIMTGGVLIRRKVKPCPELICPFPDPVAVKRVELIRGAVVCNKKSADPVNDLATIEVFALLLRECRTVAIAFRQRISELT